MKKNIFLHHIFVALTHQQVLDQLSHKCCSLWWLFARWCQLHQCRQKVLALLYILYCLLKNIQIRNEMFNHLRGLHRSLLLFLLHPGCSVGCYTSVAAWQQMQVCFISRTYFAHCYCGDCGPSSSVDGPGDRSWGPNWALYRQNYVMKFLRVLLK